MTISNTTSLLLIFNPQQNQQQATENFLQKQELVNVNQPQTNLSYLNQEGETLKIATVRDLISNSAFSTYSDKKQLFVILHADKSSIPAQNALLKIVEEPPANTQIILAVSEPSLLLPTIHSRCHKIFLDQIEAERDQASKDMTLNVTTVLQQICSKKFDYPQAIELAEQYKTREDGSQLVMSLITALHQQLNKPLNQNYSSTHLAKIINNLLQCHRDLQKNLNVRLALEHCFFEIIRGR
jgi:hypothetical protein